MLPLLLLLLLYTHHASFFLTKAHITLGSAAAEN
jgi:hypothetical protein